ncbi:Protein LDB19 [Candida viswanathii]|uniref:Protein LDB19 n=1 Tax=Candida viswanathii TaxID=5486 RepID=A0A367YCB0_9ASCO|nr:Protein LDB19 [Candida viswanathii]
MSLLARVLHLSSEKAALRRAAAAEPSSSSSSKPSTSSDSLTPTTSASSTRSVNTRSPASPQNTKKSTYSLSIKIESPPIILYGNPQESTGSIISGILKLENAETMDLENVTLALVQTMKYTKPFVLPNSSSVASCKDCTVRINELARWDVLTANATFPPGEHAYPFSHLLPGSLPPSSKLGSSHSHSFIKYELKAVGRTAEGETKELVLPVNIARLVIRGPDRNSVRIFPPTEVTARAVLPNVIYPKATFPIELKIDNVVSASKQRRWRMRKLSWRIEENIKVKAHTCEKHAAKLQTTEKAYKKANSSKSNSKRLSSSSMHHSTVTTNVSLIPSPSNQQQSSPTRALQDGIPDAEETEEDAGEHDMEEAIRSGPSHAHENFAEDFLNPTASSSSATTTTHHPALTVQPTIYTPHPVDIDKHLYLEETRTVSYGEIKSGWKSDFSGSGKIELVANISTVGCFTGMTNHIMTWSTDDAPIHMDTKFGANFSCDIDDPELGVFVNHTMIVEVVVAEELVHNVERKRSNSVVNLSPSKSQGSSGSGNDSDIKPTRSTEPIQMGVPTGAARVLRMQFKLPITERSGLGIAWDDEVPPTYEDVSNLSPPTYGEPSSSSATVSPVQSARTTPSQTPRLIIGRGDTPLMGSFGLDGHTESIDSLVNHGKDNIQEFSL